MTSQRTADIISGIFLAAVGILIVYAAFQIKSVFGERLPPRTLPLVLGSITVVTGTLLSVRAYFYKGQEMFVEWPDREGWVRLIVTVVFLMAYLFLIEILGVAVASFLFSFSLIYYLDGRIFRSLYVSVPTAVVIQILFVKFLQLSFPPAFWEQY
jgi:hypothetical protein